MHAKTGLRATWDPGKPLKLGQVGKLDNFGVFSVFTSLEKEGIETEIMTDTTNIDMDYTSHNSVSIKTKVSGTAPTAGSVFTDVEAGFSIGFKNEKSILFQSTGNKTSHITNMGEISTKIIQKYRDGNWPKDWLIITTLTETDTATIIISNSSNGTLELKAKAGVGAGTLKLTDASLDLSVAREQGSSLKYITQSGLTPLYRLMGIRKPLFGQVTIGEKAADRAVNKEISTDDLIHMDLTDDELNQMDE
jgi:hypothetical protein